MNFGAAIVGALATLTVASALVSGLAVAPAEGVTAAVARAKVKLAEKDYQSAVDILQDRLRREAGDVAAHELIAGALMQLDRGDEAAHHLEIALRRAKSEGKEDRIRALLAQLTRADPLAYKRNTYFERVVGTLCDAAEELHKKGHTERAIELVERLPPAAMPGKDATRVETLLETLRAKFKEVRLDEAAANAVPTAELPLFEFESTHYRFACHLEPDVVKRMGTVMDDIHSFYVQVYFDGDEKKARAQKPTIRVHPTKAKMLEGWGGGSAPEGWWSPGTNEVVTFDTRNTGDGSGRRGTLDAMLVTLFHEASHQFMTLLSRGGFTPAWLNEGTATFFEGTTAMSDGRVLWPAAALGRLRNLVSSLGTGKPTARETVTYADPGSYGGEFYPFGWGLCYFLQEYEDAATLEFVYRPLYAEYRSRVIQRGGDPMGIFEDVFLGKNSPLGHKTFEEFERDWKAWIIGVVDPLNRTDDNARKLRMKKVEAYLLAADAAKGNKKSKVDENELLLRALGHIEYVRSQIDTDAQPRGELLLMQADVLERLKRLEATAPLIEKILDLADAGKFELDPARYEDLSKRLAKLDQRNAGLRTARSKVAGLARAGAVLLNEYRASKKPSLILRSYTFAALAGAALNDKDGLVVVADELRNQARDAGLLLGTIASLGSNPTRWSAVLKTPPTRFAAEGDVTYLECVRASAFIDLDVPLAGEYAWRARLQHTQPVEMGTAMGAVIAGNPEGDWTMIGLDERGWVGIWILERTGRDGTSLMRKETLYPEKTVDVAQPVDLEIHVRRDSAVEVKVGGEVLVTRLKLDSGVARHVGVFAKNAAIRFEGAIVEIYP